MDVDVEQLLDQKLEQMPGMTLGQLDNGLRYVILPNKVPPNRFEAHLEMHVGERTVHCPCCDDKCTAAHVDRNVKGTVHVCCRHRSQVWLQ